jgi:hypothetical protein
MHGMFTLGNIGAMQVHGVLPSLSTCESSPLLLLSLLLLDAPRSFTGFNEVSSSESASSPEVTDATTCRSRDVACLLPVGDSRAVRLLAARPLPPPPPQLLPLLLGKPVSPPLVDICTH